MALNLNSGSILISRSELDVNSPIPDEDQSVKAAAVAAAIAMALLHFLCKEACSRKEEEEEEG